MSKGLITLIGLVVSLGVIALGIFVVALPIYLQSVAVSAQTATTAGTNALYQTQLDNLRAEQENLEEVTESVAALRAQIPATAQLDDVFEVIGRAAGTAGVAIVSITAGERVPYETRSAEDLGQPVGLDVSGTPGEPDPAATDGGEGSGVPEPEVPETAAGESGRMEIDFAIQVTADDMAKVTAFLDALRAGPRLVNPVATVATSNGEGSITVQVTALTYFTPEG